VADPDVLGGPQHGGQLTDTPGVWQVLGNPEFVDRTAKIWAWPARRSGAISRLIMAPRSVTSLPRLRRACLHPRLRSEFGGGPSHGANRSLSVGMYVCVDQHYAGLPDDV